MPLLTVSETLDWPIEEVWALLGDFGGLPRWSPAIPACTLEGSGVGSHRLVQIGTGVASSQIRERLEAYDAQAHFVSYRPVSGSTLPLADPLMSQRLTALGPRQTRIDWVIDGRPTQPEAEVVEKLRARYIGRIQDLRNALKTGA